MFLTFTTVFQEEIEKVQNRVARFVTRNYCFETGSMTGKSRWESLKKKQDSRHIHVFLYKGLKCAANIPTDHLMTLSPPIRHCRNHRSMTFQTPFAETDIYMGSFFPHTIRDWNALPSIISSAEDAEDGVDGSESYRPQTVSFQRHFHPSHFPPH